MSDRHEWTDSGATFGADDDGIYRLAHDREGYRWREYIHDNGSGIATEDIEPAAGREILRLAARVKELEGLIAEFVVVERLKDTQALAARVKELESFIGDKVEILCHGCGSRFLKKDAEPLMAEPCDGCRRASVLEAVVAPLLPLFRERVDLWRRLNVAEPAMGIAPTPDPVTVTITAEFPVEALRALTKE